MFVENARLQSVIDTDAHIIALLFLVIFTIEKRIASQLSEEYAFGQVAFGLKICLGLFKGE
jgi:hypothetical protein